MEVNEEILEQYLKVVKKWFYVGDIPFKVPHNYSNIDVLGYNPENKAYYDFEVKFRSAFSLSNNTSSIKYMSDQFRKYRKQRENKLKEYIGNKKTIKVLVTTHKMLGNSPKKRNAMEEKFHKKMTSLGYESEIWYFDKMIPILVEHVDKRGRYNTQLLQTIRMLKIYNKNT